MLMNTAEHQAPKDIWDKRLWRQVTPELYRFIFKMCGDTHVTEDLLQDTLVKGLSFQDRHPEQTFSRAWIFKIALNTVRTFQVRKRDMKSSDLLLHTMAASDSVDDSAKAAQMQALQVAMQDLPAEQKEILVLRKFQNLSYREISDITGVSEGTLKARLHYAIRKLKTMMQRGHA